MRGVRTGVPPYIVWGLSAPPPKHCFCLPRGVKNKPLLTSYIISQKKKIFPPLKTLKRGRAPPFFRGCFPKILKKRAPPLFWGAPKKIFWGGTKPFGGFKLSQTPPFLPRKFFLKRGAPPRGKHIFSLEEVSPIGKSSPSGFQFPGFNSPGFHLK